MCITNQIYLLECVFCYRFNLKKGECVFIERINLSKQNVGLFD